MMDGLTFFFCCSTAWWLVAWRKFKITFWLRGSIYRPRAELTLKHPLEIDTDEARFVPTYRTLSARKYAK